MQHECRFPIGIKRRQDVIFNLLCLEHLKRAYFLNYIGYHYRWNENSICNRYNPDMIDILIDYLKALKGFITENHGHDIKYEKAFGKHILSCGCDIEAVYCFHPSHFVTPREYEQILNKFFTAVNADYYFAKCDFSDMDSLGKRIRFYLLSRHYWRLFYWLKYLKCKIAR